MKGRKKQVVIFIDNTDQRSEQIQQEAFLISQEISENWPTTGKRWSSKVWSGTRSSRISRNFKVVLDLACDTRSYLALQYWTSRREATTSSDDYVDWYRQYEPILERWNKLMSFEEECECEDLEC